MKNPVYIKFAFILFIIYSTSHICFSQNPVDETLKLSTDLVVLDAQVLNKKTGIAIGNLKKEDFAIYEDGVKEEITHFSQDQLPLSILLVIDTSGSVWDVIIEMRDKTIQSLEHLKDRDEVAVLATASRTQIVQDFTTDRKLVVEKIQALDKKSLGRDGILLHEALYQAAVHMNKAANPVSRRVIIVITDNLSTQKIGQGHSESEALNELYESAGVVCGLKISSLDEMILKFDPFFYAVKPFLFRGNIKTYADKTGGIVLKSSKEDLTEKLSAMIDKLRTRYAIGYVSTNTKSDGKYRKIKLQLLSEAEKREGNPAIITRKGYYGRKSKSE
jgi:VWFA-related protein